MRTTPDRIRHAISFEVIGLLLVIPLGAIGFGMDAQHIGVIAILAATMATLYLGIGLWQALVMDVAFVVFYLVYAFAFNWTYDQIFPLPETA